MNKWQLLLKKISFYLGLIALATIGSYVSYRVWLKYDSARNFTQFLNTIIDYKIYASANITVGKILLLIFLLVIGVRFAKFVSYKIVDKVLLRTNLNKGAQAAFENLSYYSLVSIFILVALNIAEVPLTIFTLFGGALAIGLGFGSQNILSNFISGIILQVEQPVKVGDIIEVEGVIGTIEHIGGRSTKIVSANNTHMILPNSYLLDKKLVNWTLQDNIVRSKITLSLSLDVDLKLAEDTIRRTVAEFPNIMATPEPKVFLDDIGAYSLNYIIYFWVPIQGTMDRSSIESLFRVNLLGNLKKEGISIPYPTTNNIVQQSKQ